MIIARAIALMRLAVMAFAAMLTAANAASAQTASVPGGDQVILVGVGGNSECFHHGGIYELLYGRGAASDGRSGVLARTVAAALGIDRRNIHPLHFSWTGDNGKDTWCQPRHLDWVTGGGQRILDALSSAPGFKSGERIVIAGWSNGGATAYELACDLARAKPGRVTLLVTLDAAAWTTRPCTATDGRPLRPAQKWIAVYTKSRGLAQSIKATNIIGLFGRAWDDRFPPSPDRADQLIRLEPASHGDSMCMWTNCVVPSLLSKSKDRTINQAPIDCPEHAKCTPVR